jgi:hypothetical protein
MNQIIIICLLICIYFFIFKKESSRRKHIRDELREGLSCPKGKKKRKGKCVKI